MEGIGNTGNSCYMASIVQCLRCVRKHLRFPSPGSVDLHLSGDMEDAHEFYLWIMNHILQGTPLERELTIRFEDDTKAHFLIMDHKLSYEGPRIASNGRALCVVTHPTYRLLQDVDHLLIDGYRRMHFVAGVAFLSEVNHYYAIVEEDGRFMECNDSHVSIAKDCPHNLCIMFFICESNAYEARSSVFGDSA